VCNATPFNDQAATPRGRVLRIRKRQFSTAFPIPFCADFVQIGKASMHSRENSHCNWPSLYSALFTQINFLSAQAFWYIKNDFIFDVIQIR